ncbi:MAG: hypothetical protein AB7W37_13665 [Syntrophobacteraceae bacterium]
MVKLKRRIDMKAPTAEELIKDMKQFLPITMYPLNAAIMVPKGQGVDVQEERELMVTSVTELGDMGGVVCGIQENDGKTISLVSITHLKVAPDHPLSLKIMAYQKHRIKKLAKQARNKQKW